MTVIICRTRGPAPVKMGQLSEKASNQDAGRDEFMKSEDGELHRLVTRNGKRVHTKPRHEFEQKAIQKVEGKATPTKNVFAVGLHQSRLQSQDSHQWRTSEICTQESRRLTL